MSLEDTINRIIGRLSPSNEANTIDRIIFPILRELGWDIHHELEGLPEVEREYVVGKKQRKGGQRADIALLSNEDNVQKLVCLIEVKSPNQKLDNHIDQIVQQAFHGGAGICTLTNGKHWRVYLPFERGSISERRLPLIDLEIDPKESAAELQKLLGKTALLNGSAEKYAKEVARQKSPLTNEVMRGAEENHIVTKDPKSVDNEASIPQRNADAQDYVGQSLNIVKAGHNLLFRNGDEPQLIEEPGSTSSSEDVDRWEANEQVCKIADSILARCEDTNVEFENVPDYNEWIEWHFDKAFILAQHTWLETNEVRDARFNEDLWSDELGEYFTYSHFYNTNKRFEAVLAGERLFNEMADKIKAEFGSIYFLYHDHLYELMVFVSYWSGKQEDNVFTATVSTIDDIMKDELVSGILSELRTEFAESDEKSKTSTPAKPSSRDPQVFTFLGKEYRAKSKVGVVRDLLSLVHQQFPEGLQALEGKSIGIFLSSEKDELNLPEQIRGTHFYFEKDWFAYDLVLYLYVMCDEFDHKREDMTISYPHGPVGIGDIFKPEYPDSLHDRSVKGKITATSEDGGKKLVVEFPSPKPSEIKLFGESRQIKSHADAARTALSQMLKAYPKSFHRFEYSPANRAYFISKDPDDFARAGKIPKTDYYLNSQMFSQPKNPEMLDLIFARMMSVFGYTLDDYSVNWRWHIKKK